MKIKARDVLAMSEAELWAKLEPMAVERKNQPVEIVFDDGTLKLTGKAGNDPDNAIPSSPIRATILSWYYWRIQREEPNAPLLMAHHVGNRVYDAKTHLDLLSRVFFDTLDRYREVVGQPSEETREHWMRQVMLICNDVFNMHGDELGSYVTGISITDFYNVFFHPKVRAINDELKETKHINNAMILDAHERILDLLKDPKEFPRNAVAESVVRGLVSAGQVLQCVSARGYIEDIDGNIFRNPIRVGFFEGLYKFTDYLKESRTASKSSFVTNAPMSDSEYTNRMMQLTGCVIQRAHLGDCGNQRTFALPVPNAKAVSNYMGIWFKYTPDATEWQPLRPELVDKLVGKVIHIRSLHGCLHPDEAGVCSACVGDLADSWVHDTNIGWQANADIFGRLGQMMLSNKHYAGSVSAGVFHMDELSRLFLAQNRDPCKLDLSRDLAKRRPHIVIRQAEAAVLQDIQYVDDVKILTPSMTTQLTKVEFIRDLNEGVTESTEIQVSTHGRQSSLTHEAMAFIKDKSWTLTDKGDYLISLEGWNYNLPFFELPLKHFSVVDLAAALKTAIQGRKSRPVARKVIENPEFIMDFENPDLATQFIYKLFTTKMEELSYENLQLIVAAFTARDPDNGDFRIPKPFAAGTIVSYSDIMHNRSAGAIMAFQAHHKVLVKPETYLVENRQGSPMDVCLLHDLVNE